MTVKAIFFICAQALLLQCLKAQCIGGYNRLAAAPISAAPCAGGLYAAPSSYGAGWGSSQAGSYGFGASNAATIAASNGGGLSIESSSPLAPNGVSVLSENIIEGPVDAFGALPFLGTVALEGVLPTVGSGAVAFGSGNGEVAILSEGISTAGSGLGEGALGFAAGSLNYGAGGLGYGAGALGYGAGTLGCGAGLSGLSYNYEANIGRGACGCGARAF